jgi:transcriptional regulator with XRE-family HTH domain
MDVPNLIETLVKRLGTASSAAKRLGVSDATLSRLRHGHNLPARETYKALRDIHEEAVKVRAQRRKKREAKP